MDVFAIKKGQAIELTVDKYEAETYHEYPYYRKTNNGLSFYAICPECGNPIQIVNLYREEMRQNVTGKVVLYGKHTSRRVDGFDYWNVTAKEKCSLYNPSPLGNTDIRKNSDEAKEIKLLIENNWQKIKQDIRGILGINLFNKTLDDMYKVFMDSQAYNYKAVNKYNIPYAMIRYQQGISIYNTYLFSSPICKIIIEEINNNSKFFEIQDNKIVKTGGGFNKIGIYLTKYQKKEGKQYINMVIYETYDEKIRTILKETLEMKPWIYQ